MLNGSRERRHIAGSAMTSPSTVRLDDLRKSVRRGSDHGQSCDERFEAGIGKRIVNRGQDEDVRRREQSRQIAAHARETLFARERGMRARIAASGDEQRGAAARASNGLNGQAQTFSLPAGAGEKNHVIDLLRDRVRARISPERWACGIWSAGTPFGTTDIADSGGCGNAP